MARGDRRKRYLYLKSQEGCTKLGQDSEVNSMGTINSAFARIGLAAIFTGTSISEAGKAGSVSGKTATAEILWEAVQETREKTIAVTTAQCRAFMLKDT